MALLVFLTVMITIVPTKELGSVSCDALLGVCGETYGTTKTIMVYRFWFHFLVAQAEVMSVKMMTAPRTMARS